MKRPDGELGVDVPEVVPDGLEPKHFSALGDIEVGNPPSVPAPLALAAQGLTLTDCSVPMGTMTIVDDPSTGWVEFPAPLADQDADREAFIGGIGALTKDQAAWWYTVAPGVARPAPGVGAKNPSYFSAEDVVVTARGDQASAVLLTTTVSILGGSAPDRYVLSVGDTIVHGTLQIVGWSVHCL